MSATAKRTIGGSVGFRSLGIYSVGSNALKKLTSIKINQYVVFKLYVDGSLRATKTISDDKIFRLPGGYRGKKVEIEVSGYVPIRKIEIGTSISALQQED